MVSKQRYRAQHGQRRRSCQKMLSHRGEIWEEGSTADDVLKCNGEREIERVRD